MKLQILLLFGICLLAAACHKRKYPDEKVQLEKEEVYVNGYFGNEPIALKIGTDGYYCYSSYKQGTDSVYVFEGLLKKFDCNPCPLSLQVQLSDYMQRLPGAQVVVDESLRKGNRAFIPAISKPVTVKFISHSNKDVAAVRWNFDNGYTSYDAVTSYEFGQPGLQTVSLTVQTTNNCESVVINKIFIGSTGDLFACNITADLVQNKISKFTPAITGGKAPFRYSWSFGDRQTSSEASPTHEYQYAGSYPVNLQITDADNHTCEVNYIHVAGNDNSSCAANITLVYQGRRNANLNGVKMQWTDESNTILRSDSVAQPKGSYFEIIDSHDYAPNERGEAGRLLTLRFNVLLSGGGRKVWFKSDNAAIAVTYK